MAQSLKDRIVHFHNETNSNAPSASDLVRGELAINLPAKKIYTKDHTDAVVELGGGAAGLDLDSALRLSASGQMLVGRMHVLDTTGETPGTTTIDSIDYDTVSFALPTSPSTNDRFMATVDGPYVPLLTGPVNGDTNAVVASNDLVISGVYDGTTWRVDAGASGPAGVPGADGASGATQLNELSDVTTVAVTSGHVLIADGTDYDSKVLSGNVTMSGAGVTTIANGAVTLARQANLAANSIIGNNTGSAATPLALTRTQVRSMLKPSIRTAATAAAITDADIGNIVILQNTATPTLKAVTDTTLLGMTVTFFSEGATQLTVAAGGTTMRGNAKVSQYETITATLTATGATTATVWYLTGGAA